MFENKSTIFQGLRVVEFASVLAGPSVGMFFAELGAKVYKIENKITGGDMTRKWKLPVEDENSQASAYYHSVNWGKESLYLNLTVTADKAKAIDLIRTADILISNFKADFAIDQGLDYASVKALNEGLIYAHLYGFSESDSRPAFDVVLQAEAGFLYMTGTEQGVRVKMPVALIDVLAAHHLKEGILLALLQRSYTGKGAFVSASLYHAALASLINQATNWLIAGHIPQPMGTSHPNIAPYGDLFETKDLRLVVLAVGTDKQFSQLCEILDLNEIRQNPSFANNALRVRNRKELVKVLEEKIKLWESTVLLERLKDLQVPVGLVRDMQEVFAQPEAQSMILTGQDEAGREIRCVRSIAFDILP